MMLRIKFHIFFIILQICLTVLAQFNPQDERNQQGRPQDGRGQQNWPQDGRDQVNWPQDGRDQQNRPQDGRDQEIRPQDGRDQQNRPQDGRDHEGRPQDDRNQDRNNQQNRSQGGEELSCFVCVPQYTGQNKTILQMAEIESNSVASDLKVDRATLRPCEMSMSGGGTGGSSSRSSENHGEGSGSRNSENQRESGSSRSSENQRKCGIKDSYECYTKEFKSEMKDSSETWMSRGCMMKNRKSNLEKVPGLSVQFCHDNLCNSSNINQFGWLGFTLLASLVTRSLVFTYKH